MSVYTTRVRLWTYSGPQPHKCVPVQQGTWSHVTLSFLPVALVLGHMPLPVPLLLLGSVDTELPELQPSASQPGDGELPAPCLQVAVSA